jgi:hypothetical protein
VKRALIAIALGLMGLSFQGCGSFFPKPIPSRLHCLRSRRQEQIRITRDKFLSASVRSAYLVTSIGKRY